MTDASPPASWRPVLGHTLGRGLLHLLYQCEAYGVENVPATGPVILAPNHTGFLDGPLVFALAPRAGHFLVLAQTFDGALGPLLHLVGQIPIDQKVGDRRALGQALEVLRSGGLLGIFPEGGRGRGDLADASGGVAWLAVQGHASVVPVACLGTRRTGDLAASWPRVRSRLVVDFGAPVTVTTAPGLPGRERMRLAAEQIRVAVAGHVAEAVERHGIPLPTDVPPDVRD